MRVEVVLLRTDTPEVREIDVSNLATVGVALNALQVLLNPQEKLMIYGQKVSLETKLHSGDRIEILAPLPVDPKAARRHRIERLGRKR